MTIKPVQKQSSAGQRTRFKAYVAVGDFDGHIGLGKKCSSEVATAIRGALIMAKMHLVPIRRGYWGKNSGLPHTIPMKLSGTCGSVSVRLIPAPRGTGLVARVMEAYVLQQGSVPRTHRLPRQGGRIGQGRRRVLGASRNRGRPGLLRSPATMRGAR